MNHLEYAYKEIRHRRSRSVATTGSVALAALLAVVLITFAGSYSQAVRQPMKAMGSDVLVQLTGDIPPKLEGAVFPHPNAMLPSDLKGKIKSLPGVTEVTSAVYMWDFSPGGFHSVLGLGEGAGGLASLNERLISGTPLSPAASFTALVDNDFAVTNKLKVGDPIDVGGQAMTISGLVDGAVGSKIYSANFYVSLASIQSVATSAPMIRALYPFSPTDVNLLLLKVEPSSLPAVVEKVKSLLGKKGVVSSEQSFRDALEDIFFLSEKVGTLVALVVGVFAFIFVLRATATAVNERRREMAVLQAIGWSWPAVRRQLVIENSILTLVGGLLGTLIALTIIFWVGEISVTLELPWDISSTPHFLPETNIDRSETVSVPLNVAPLVMGGVWLGTLLTGALSALGVLMKRSTQPWQQLRSE